MSLLRSQFLISLIVLGVSSLMTGKVQAQSFEDALSRDICLTIQARQFLEGDAQLGSLNLGVKVVNRQAILWGPVPSRDLAWRAEQRLRGMFELVDVRNRLTIETDSEFGPVAPEQPRVLPEPAPADMPSEPRRPNPLVVPDRRVDLAGIVTSEQTHTVRSSPVNATWHIPFLGSVTLPK